MPAPLLRQTKIVCTIGPSSSDPTILYKLAHGGMTIARINFSHGTREEQQMIIDSIREYNAQNLFPIGILMDTKGPEIRTAEVRKPIPITKDEEVVFTADQSFSDNNTTVIYVLYENFAREVPETKTIIVDNGSLTFDIHKTEGDLVFAKAQQDGEISSKRHVNLPGADLDLPSITEKDWEDIEFGIEQNFDYVALSFIRNAEEIHEVQKYVQKHGSTMKIIAKIETAQAVRNLASITQESDAVMVARGDLGAEVAFEKLPLIQEEVVTRCRDTGKPVIIATQMLESMTTHPVPTRAEITDTAFAVLADTDATMLSGETASGKYPLTALEAMTKIHAAMETYLARFPDGIQIPVKDDDEELAQKISITACKEADAILVCTTDGKVAQRISKFRPTKPIITVVPTKPLQTGLTLYYGIFPLCIPFENYDAGVDMGLTEALSNELLPEKSTVAIVTDESRSVTLRTL